MEQSGCVANDVRRVWARPMTSYGDGLNLFTTLWWTLQQLGCFSRTKNYGLTFGAVCGRPSRCSCMCRRMVCQQAAVIRFADAA